MIGNCFLLTGRSIATQRNHSKPTRLSSENLQKQLKGDQLLVLDKKPLPCVDQSLLMLKRQPGTEWHREFP